MAHRVFIDDGIDIFELDTEDIEISASFKVADIKDISKRKDSIKTIQFKGTKKNNAAFGNLLHANRTTSLSIANGVGFNYSPIRKINVSVYENSTLIFAGFLQVTNAVISNKGDGYYETVVTNNLIDLYNQLKNSYLTDIDFTDLKHRYSITNISNSWANTTERFNTTTSSFTTKGFEKGSGYIYPYIHHGVTFLDTSGGASNVNFNSAKIHGLNFRPGIYVKEYFKRIFNQSGLGLSYEIRGSQDFIDRFNAAFIPNADEKMVYKLSGFNLVFEKTDDENESGALIDLRYGTKDLSFQEYPTIPANTVGSLISQDGSSTTLLKVDRNFTTDAYVTSHFASISNPYSQQMTFRLQLVERPNPSTVWSVVGENNIKVNPSSSVSNIDINISIGERQFKENYQIALKVLYTYQNPVVIPFQPVGPHDAAFTVSSATVSFPKDNATLIKAETQLNDSDFDVIVPTAPENIKQYDFVKDIMFLMNLYSYTERDNPKKIIFQHYDDFWAYTSPQYLKQTALNWTNKVNNAVPKTIDMQVALPKSYLFTYKDDGDRLNSEYKKKWGKTFGSFNFTDNFGITDEKKVSINFSPTPITVTADTNRYHPALYIMDGVLPKPLKTNIRILYYNGLIDCAEYSIGKDLYTSSWTTDDLGTYENYPNASSYYYINDVPVEDLNFGRPNELYFTATDEIFNLPSAYSKYYINQTTELTSGNVFTIELSMYLNEIDIAKLDLRIPVFIDNGEFGHAYYKVLAVDYKNNNSPSTVLLQKIVIG